MADEVIISEYGRPVLQSQGTVQPVYGEPVTSQVLDIATLSAAMNAGTRVIRLQSKGTGFWYKQGTASVSAAADTNGSHWLPSDGCIDLTITPSFTYVDTAADA